MRGPAPVVTCPAAAVWMLASLSAVLGARPSRSDGSSKTGIVSIASHNHGVDAVEAANEGSLRAMDKEYKIKVTGARAAAAASANAGAVVTQVGSAVGAQAKLRPCEKGDEEECTTEQQNAKAKEYQSKIYNGYEGMKQLAHELGMSLATAYDSSKRHKPAKCADVSEERFGCQFSAPIVNAKWLKEDTRDRMHCRCEKGYHCEVPDLKEMISKFDEDKNGETEEGKKFGSLALFGQCEKCNELLERAGDCPKVGSVSDKNEVAEDIAKGLGEFFLMFVLLPLGLLAICCCVIPAIAIRMFAKP